MSFARDSRISHIVVLMMENRSFDHMLGFLKAENPEIRGVSAGDFTNPDATGNPVPVGPGATYQGQLVNDPGHDATDVYFQMFGVPFGQAASSPTMNGFARSYEQMGGKGADIMKCFQPAQLPVLSALARQYCICDQWFSSVPGPTLPNRAFAHFGTSFGRLDMSPDHFRAKPNIYGRLSRAGHSARIYYYSSWSGTQGMTFLLADQSQYFGLFGDFKNDCKKNKLPDYCFIEPAYSGQGGVLANDQHPDHNVQAGDNFIRDVYEAIRSNDKVWGSTMLLILWDEHGGIFDHEVPPLVSHPDGFVSTAPPFDFTRLGVRVPAVVVSPWVAPGTVDHTLYEHASIPATATEQFIGGPMTNSPFAREQFANTFLHLATLVKPRNDTPAFAPAVDSAASASTATRSVVAGAARTLKAARPMPEIEYTAPLSSLLKDQLEEVQHVLRRNHPALAKLLNPKDVKTEAEASAFIARAMNAIRPDKPAVKTTAKIRKVASTRNVKVHKRTKDSGKKK